MGSVNIQNWDVMDYYRYDPLIGDDIKPDGASDKIFYWFKKFPTNNHLEYEGDILQGRMMANAYIQHFTDDELRQEWKDDDSSFDFRSTPVTLPSMVESLARPIFAGRTYATTPILPKPPAHKFVLTNDTESCRNVIPHSLVS